MGVSFLTHMDMKLLGFFFGGIGGMKWRFSWPQSQFANDGI